MNISIDSLEYALGSKAKTFQRQAISFRLFREPDVRIRRADSKAKRDRLKFGEG